MHPRIPRRPRQPVSLQVSYHQTVATDSGDSMGCMPYRSRDRGEAVHGRWHTIPVAIRWPIIPIPLHVGDRQAPETYRFRCNQGQKGSVMHRFRGYRGKLDAKKYQVPPRFPRLRGCTRPIVNSWVKFFPWGTGEGGPFWACRLSSKIDMRRVHGRDILLVCFSLVWSAPYLRLVKQNRHAAVPRGGTYRPRRRVYSSGG